MEGALTSTVQYSCSSYSNSKTGVPVGPTANPQSKSSSLTTARVPDGATDAPDAGDGQALRGACVLPLPERPLAELLLLYTSFHMSGD
jgi:hypothetical protein